MAKSQLKVATIVGSNTDTAWSQTYHAGGVTAVVSVKPKSDQDTASLSLVGKDLLNTFESEYFTLETKSLASIKGAVEVTYKKSKETHDISLIVSAVIQNAVYLVLAGPGKILLIRKGSVATLLEQEAEEVLSASGFLETGDVMVLETHSFSEKVPSSLLLETLSANSVMDAVEILSPSVHKEKDGSATALLFSYEEEKKEETMPEIQNVAEAPEITPSRPAPSESQPTKPEEQFMVSAPPIRKDKKLFTHRQKIFLTVAVALAVVFVGAIYFSLQKKQTGQDTALFSQVYPPALTKYQEGQGLENLNSSLAHQDFVQAQQMLESAKGKFPQNSSEEKQILSLLDKVNVQLTPTTTAPTTPVTKVAAGTDTYLDFAIAHSNIKYFTQDTNNYYYADSSGIFKAAQTGGSVKQIIQNGGDWKSLGGLGTYLGNMYVVDTANGIDKYPGGSSGYGNKTPYFVGTTPDLSKAVSMAIDGSIWVLTSDGFVTKYTKGTQDNFTITGLSQPLSSPTQITTTVDDNNIYILDNGNSRLVVIKKDGTFVAEYGNAQLKSATQLNVNETAKKAYFLSDGSVYELDMK